MKFFAKRRLRHTYVPVSIYLKNGASDGFFVRSATKIFVRKDLYASRFWLTLEVKETPGEKNLRQFMERFF